MTCSSSSIERNDSSEVSTNTREEPVSLESYKKIQIALQKSMEDLKKSREDLDKTQENLGKTRHDLKKSRKDNQTKDATLEVFKHKVFYLSRKAAKANPGMSSRQLRKKATTYAKSVISGTVPKITPKKRRYVKKKGPTKSTASFKSYGLDTVNEHGQKVYKFGDVTWTDRRCPCLKLIHKIIPCWDSIKKRETAYLAKKAVAKVEQIRRQSIAKKRQLHLEELDNNPKKLRRGPSSDSLTTLPSQSSTVGSRLPLSQCFTLGVPSEPNSREG